MCALLLCTAAACGGKSKKQQTTPGQSGAAGPAGDTAGGVGAPDVDYEAGITEYGNIDVPNAPEEGDSSAELPPGADPSIRPPGLDLPPAERARRVIAHIKTGSEALNQQNNPDKAIHEAKAALAVDESSVPAMVLLAHAYHAKGFVDLVEDVLTKALERGGENNKTLHFLMGLVHEERNKPQEAVASYERAVALDNNYRSALMNLGVHHLKNKRFEEAVALFERLTGELGYVTTDAITNLGSAYRGLSAKFTATDITRRNELLLKAERAYKMAVDKDKNYAPVYYNLGLLYLDADPFPQGNDDMDILVRLKRAKTYFDEYRRLPGADQTLVDEQVSVAQKLIDKEELRRKKQEERERRRKEREAGGN